MLETLAVQFGSGTITLTSYYIDQSGTWRFELNATIIEVNSGSVGGNVISVDKLALLGVLLTSYAPSIGLALAAIIAAVVATGIYLKRVKRRHMKQ